MPPYILELLGLFGVAFLSASFLPFQSEILFGAMLLNEKYDPWALLAVASIGNTLGSGLNWWLGMWIAHFETKRWFPIKRALLVRAEGWFRRWGKWSLLLSWAPFIGDPLTMIAGVLRTPFWQFLIIVAIAKTGRYLAVMAALS